MKGNRWFAIHGGKDIGFAFISMVMENSGVVDGIIDRRLFFVGTHGHLDVPGAQIAAGEKSVCPIAALVSRRNPSRVSLVAARDWDCRHLGSLWLLRTFRSFVGRVECGSTGAVFRLECHTNRTSPALG
jgi:hypothetical protein